MLAERGAPFRFASLPTLHHPPPQSRALRSSGPGGEAGSNEDRKGAEWGSAAPCSRQTSPARPLLAFWYLLSSCLMPHLIKALLPSPLQDLCFFQIC